MTNPLKCPICGILSNLKCSGCKNVVYCGKEHQKLHWRKGHKSECKCFEVTHNEILGRHMRATRDIKKGEIIFRESPLIYGPKVASKPICLGCHRTLQLTKGQKQLYKCSKCTWPLCDRNCENSINHIDECELMSNRKFICKIDCKNNVELKKESSYCVILPLRCIIMQMKNSKIYKKIDELEDHLDERIDTPLYKILKSNLITFIKTILGFKHLDEMEILRIAAILDTNTFEIRQTKYNIKIRGLYPLAAMISHNCISNARHVFDDNMQILFIAKIDIPKGEIISTSYTQPLKSTLMRREHLSQAKCFDCLCQRCSDPTEFNTFTGAILCSKCKIGKIISTNSLDNSAIWRCQLCSHEILAKQISYGNLSMCKEIEMLNKNSPKEFEDFLVRYNETLHNRNTHVLQVKYALTQLYGNIEGFYLNELTDAGVERKLELCYELLEIADLFDPGSSQFRGNLLLDLQEILVVQTNREYEKGLITRDKTKENLMKAMEILKEAVAILKLDPDMAELLQQRTDNLTQEIEMN